MNKVTSFLLIILIIYISYEYCSRPVIEGADPVGPNKGKDPSTDDKHVDTGPVLTDIDCRSNMTDDIIDDWKYIIDRKEGKLIPEKKTCMDCLQGSTHDGTIQRYLANIGYEANKDGTGKDTHESYYALRYCDALAANCSAKASYANASADWATQDCKHVSFTDTSLSARTRFFCTVLSNSVVSFFLDLIFSGVSCTLNIGATTLWHKIK